MSAKSKVEIARRSLLLAGLDSNIESFSGDNPESSAAELFYDSSRREVLAAFDWGFARRIEALSPAAEAPADGWSFRYDFPADCITFQGIQNPLGPQEADPPHKLQTINGRTTILTNTDLAIARYTSDFEDTRLFTPWFTQSVMYLLAYYLAQAIAEDDNKAARLFNQFSIAINRAGASDGNQETPFPETDANWLRIRNS